MPNYSQRLSKIEQHLNPETVRVIWASQDETDAEAERRANAHPGKTIIVRWLRSENT